MSLLAVELPAGGKAPFEHTVIMFGLRGCKPKALISLSTRLDVVVHTKYIFCLVLGAPAALF